MAEPEPTPQLRAAYALHMARQYRHHKNCRCGVYHGFCSAADALWTRAMDRELELMCE